MIIFFTEQSSAEAVGALVRLLRSSNRYPKGVKRTRMDDQVGSGWDVLVQHGTPPLIVPDHLFDVNETNPRAVYSIIEKLAIQKGLL